MIQYHDGTCDLCGNRSTHLRPPTEGEVEGLCPTCHEENMPEDKPLYFQVPVLLTIAADSYQDAVKEAETFVEGMSGDAGMGVEVVTQFDHDSEKRRVIRLHPEDCPVEWE